ncbi:hypothetical protein MNEG_10721 [Monoraphidium neglectum]|uniref:Uncharacterized protein n=1 Tax=Monoraphidium neglectum TaxID=145388 RepID=A0A0D2MRQ8_9CHLO|nr:hypothetical protein MNEG_10721 [Monoraphidium neglectum]KIY97240.1 hypothetical protein MNEG_10721 [Monoraphidium neglectum]|eukprot:XP_013896260.1 hypothetical protein MNEG_10721 [Monoraphidium neglectum]
MFNTGPGIMFEQTSHQLWPNINTREQQQQELQDSYPVNTLGAARTELLIKKLKSEVAWARRDAANARARVGELQGQIAQYNKQRRRYDKSVVEDLMAAEDNVCKAEKNASIWGQEHRAMKASKARISALSADNEAQLRLMTREAKALRVVVGWQQGPGAEAEDVALATSQAALAHEKDEAVARASALQAVVERNMAALQAAQQKLAGFKARLEQEEEKVVALEAGLREAVNKGREAVQAAQDAQRELASFEAEFNKMSTIREASEEKAKLLEAALWREKDRYVAAQQAAAAAKETAAEERNAAEKTICEEMKMYQAKAKAEEESRDRAVACAFQLQAEVDRLRAEVEDANSRRLSSASSNRSSVRGAPGTPPEATAPPSAAASRRDSTSGAVGAAPACAPMRPPRQSWAEVFGRLLCLRD